MVFRTYFIICFVTLSHAINGQLKNIVFKSVPEYSSEIMIYSGCITKITDNAPLDSIEISVEEYGVVGYTNIEGFFEVEAPENISKLCFKKQGYIGASKVFINDNERKSRIELEMFPEDPNEKEQKLIEENFQFAGSNDNSGDILKLDRLLLKAANKTEVPATIRVLMANNTVVTMNMDEYLKGVVPSEVPTSWNMDALKAQAVAARSYASANFKHNSEGADVCTTTHCQAWKSTHNDKTDLAVTETSNMSVKYEGNIINALFFSHCNGTTRNNEDVWGGTPVPYLRSKSCNCGFTSHNAHGVGMCQYGCQAMALAGSTWENILTYYYTGTSIDNPSSTTGTVKGVIYHGSDNSNLDNRIIGATVKVNTGQQMISGEYGLYSFDLAPGRYTITACKEGFKNTSVTRDVTSGNTIWGSIQLTEIVGLSEVNASKKHIYPNPAKDFINIEPDDEARIIITSLTGHVEYNEIIKEKTIINVCNYNRGVYIVKVIGIENTISEKVILVY